ncbi:MAG: AsmA-like C-terminal domain-containing protein [Kiloniellaceae bacterium]
MPGRRRRRSRTGRAIRFGVELIGGLFAAAVLVVAVAAWRLSEGPVRTDFLTPYLQAAINEAGGNSIGIGGTFLVWEQGSRGLVMHAADVTVRDPDGRLIAALPEVAFELSSSAILDGTLAPNQIEVIAPRIRLLRDKDGRISFGSDATAPAVQGPAEAVAPATADGAQGEDLVLGRMVRELLTEKVPGNPLSYLDEVRIRDGQVFVRDEKLGLSWAAPAAEISLRRDIAGLAGDVNLGFAGRGDPATLDIAFLFDKSDGVVDLAAGFSDISLAKLATAFPVLAPVGGLTSRISGSVYTSLSLAGEVGHTGFDLQGFAGSLAIPGVEMEPVPVRELTMRGRYDSTESRFDLDAAHIALGTAEAPGPLFDIAGVFDHDPLTRGWQIAAEATLQEVQIAQLPAYWPASVAPDARPWVVENVTRGLVDKATAALKVTVPDGDFAAAEIDEFGGTLQYRDLEVHYLRPLQPVQALAGTATFDLDALRFAVASGRLDGLAIGQSTVAITGFSAAAPEKGIYERLDIATQVVGPVYDALAIIDHQRLGLLSKVGFSAAGSEGTVSAELGFQFPLAKNLDFEDITLQVAAAVKDGTLKNVFQGQDMTAAQLAVELDEGGLQLAGPMSLGGVPLTVRWQESFADAPKYRSVMEAEIPRIDDAERARFGLDIGEAVQGPMKASVSMVQLPSGLATLRVSTDLAQTTVSLPEIHWRKEVGTEGSLSLTIELDGEGPLAYRDIVMQAGDLALRGSATPGAGGEGLGEIALEHVSFGRSSLQNVAVSLGEAGTVVSIGQGTLDAEPFLSGDEEADEAAGTVAETAAGRDGPPAPRSFEPLQVRAPDLRMLYFGEEQRLEQVNLELRRGRAGWETIRLSGSIPQQYWSPRREAAALKQTVSPVSADAAAVQPVAAELTRRYLQLSFAPDATGSGQRLLAQSDDLGALLRATNITDTVVGGRIQVTGHSDGPSPSHPIHAKVEARDFVMVNAPAMAKLLTVASFTGVLDLLRGEGIPFQGMDGEFVLDDGVATTDLMRIYGASLGFTAKGKIDFDGDAIDLTGVVVPAYSINNFLSKIPLLGTIMTGGEGEGLFAVVYNVRGPVDDPAVSVNPLSALTPGFLRNIFTAGTPGDEAPRALPEREQRIDK